MCRFPSLARRIWTTAFLTSCGLALAVACGGSSDEVDTGSSSGGPDGYVSSDGAPGVDDGGAASRDAAGDAGEVVTDGGANIDLDAGEPATLPDGGACHDLRNTAKAVVSTCASVAPILGGGTIVPGTYELVSVVALATPSFCANQFVPAGFKQTLRLDANGNAFAYESVVEIGGLGPRRREGTATTTATNKLQLAQTCPAALTTEATYASGVVNGKQRLVLRQPYGRGEALYTYQLP